MKEIPLTKGYLAIVDDEDYAFLSQWRWHALVCKKHVYGQRNAYDSSGTRHHVMMHRVVCPPPDGCSVDHINGNGLDNRRCNLRPVTHTQNMWNREANIKGSSKHKGVYWHKQHRKWVASIQVNKRRYHIGLFVAEADAARAYARRAAAEFGEYNRENDNE